jgi:ubiquitin C-terminal hydrolase
VLQGAWEIIQDDLLHQRKKYTFTKSKLTGIRNTSSTCYIISAMQALFMTKSLPELLKNYSKEMIETTTWDHHSSKIKLKFLYELNALMNELK